MKKNIFAFLFLAFTLTVFGQNFDVCSVNIPNEDIYLHIDRERYVVGETIWFKAYCLEDGLLNSMISSIIYIELFDNYGNSYMKKKYRNIYGTSFGDIMIPKDLKSGNYFLRAYTKYQRNFPVENLFTRVISILNPYSFNKTQVNYDISNVNDSILDIDKERINFKRLKLKLNKKNYKRRELVKLEVLNEVSDDLDLSISVRSVGSSLDSATIKNYFNKNSWFVNSSYFCYPEKFGFLEFPKKIKSYKRINDLEFLPDFRDLTISVLIKDHNSKQIVSNKRCISAVVSNRPQIHVDDIREHGRFVFTFNGLEEENMLFVGVPDNTKTYDILVKNDFENRLPKINYFPLLFDKSINKDFEEIFANHQITNSFDYENYKETFRVVENDLPNYNLKAPDFSVDVKQFILLPTMEDIFLELVPGVSVVGAMGSRYLNVFNKYNRELYSDPLVLLDNVPIFDIERLLLLNAKLIDSIDVYYSKYYIGDNFFNGIISIKTSTDNFASFKWRGNSVFVPYLGVNKPNVFKTPDYSLGSDSRVPDFRTTLYWNPNYLQKEENEITFYTSDFCSKYQVIVKGFDEKGVAYFGSEFIEVVR